MGGLEVGVPGPWVILIIPAGGAASRAGREALRLLWATSGAHTSPGDSQPI